MEFAIDEIDLAILYEMQSNGRITNVELAKRVGISPPPCLRRVKSLEGQGYIKGYRATLDEKKLGFKITMFSMIGLRNQSEQELINFEHTIKKSELVRECYMLSGEIDFLLKCVAPNIEVAQKFVLKELTAMPNVDSVKTALTITTTKYEPGTPKL